MRLRTRESWTLIDSRTQTMIPSVRRCRTAPTMPLPPPTRPVHPSAGCRSPPPRAIVTQPPPLRASRQMLYGRGCVIASVACRTPLFALRSTTAAQDTAALQRLTSSVEDDAFGLSVDISGSTIVVGAWGDNFGKGAAYVFERTRGTDAWTLTAKVTAQLIPFPASCSAIALAFRSPSTRRRSS